jgi:opacity protein-like surface antigen
MTKQLFIAAAAAVLAPVAILAQTAQAGSSFQAQGWARFPGAGATVIHSNDRDGQTGPVLGRPLSANEVRTAVQTLSDGSHVNSSETNQFHRDGQGRMRIETETGIMIYDSTIGFIYDLTKANKTYTKYASSKDAKVTIAAAAHYSSSHSESGKRATASTTQAGGPVTEDLPPQSINGIWAKGSRVTTTIPAGTFGNDRDLKVVNERWFSDDLKLLVKSSNSDPRFGVTTYELTNILQGEPDLALFQLPAGYVESADRHGAAKHE